MMKSSLCFALCILPGATTAFMVAPTQPVQCSRTAALEATNGGGGGVNRNEFLSQSLTAIVVTTGAVLIPNVDSASARGRATLEKTYERYAPRIQAGSEFYSTELKQLVANNDWNGIKLALQEPPERQSGDLNKPDAGVSARAAAAGGFSNARVLVAADLFGAAFSESSITPKTKRMQKYVAETRSVIAEMQSVARQALGEESSGGGGLFGLGAKKPSTTELSNKMKDLYTKGGNTWNEYIAAANDNLALQFTRFEYVN